MAMVIPGWRPVRGAALALALALLLAPALSSAAGARSAPISESVSQGRELYLAAQYPQAQEVLRQALSQLGLSRPQRAEAQYWLGLVYLGQGHQPYALEALAEARRLDPNLRPDPTVMSPEALALWQQAAPGSAPPASLEPPAAQAPAPPQAEAPGVYGQAPQDYSQAPAPPQAEAPGVYGQAPQDYNQAPAPSQAQAPGVYSQAPASPQAEAPGVYGQAPQDYSQAPAPSQAQAPGVYGQAPPDYSQAPAPEPAINETPLSEPPPSAPTAWVSQLITAQGMKGGRPQGVRSVFSPQDETIHLWFELHDVEETLELRAVWTYLEGQSEEILDSVARVKPGDRWGLFTCSLRPGQSWPQGRYRVEVFLGQQPVGAAFFSVR
ncbi:MAG: hypothetical protein V1806_14360 [Pseudomonadota bacterium]